MLLVVSCWFSFIYNRPYKLRISVCKHNDSLFLLLLRFDPVFSVPFSARRVLLHEQSDFLVIAAFTEQPTVRLLGLDVFRGQNALHIHKEAAFLRAFTKVYLAHFTDLMVRGE